MSLGRMGSFSIHEGTSGAVDVDEVVGLVVRALFEGDGEFEALRFCEYSLLKELLGSVGVRCWKRVASLLKDVVL